MSFRVERPICSTVNSQGILHLVRSTEHCWKHTGRTHFGPIDAVFLEQGLYFEEQTSFTVLTYLPQLQRIHPCFLIESASTRH